MDKYEHFETVIESLRPRLHRYLSRLCGSPVDGEDVLQEVLVSAFTSLKTLEDPNRLEPWVFSIAHNKAIDFLRKRNLVRDLPLDDEAPVQQDWDELETKYEIRKALTQLVTLLPPKERACLLLKDLLDFSLSEVASIVGSTEGGVKSALHRARQKLAKMNDEVPSASVALIESALTIRYLELFNKKDWDGVYALLRADARLELVGMTELAGREKIKSNYFVNYGNLGEEFSFKVMVVAGVETVVQYRRAEDGGWSPLAVLQLSWRDGKVLTVRDYVHVEYLLEGWI